MDVCEVYRIPHSELLGWDPYDRHKAVMHQIRKAERCPGCGVHPDETDPRAGGHPGRFGFEIRDCPTCTVLDEGERELKRRRDDPGVMTTAGMRVRLKRREVLGG